MSRAFPDPSLQSSLTIEEISSAVKLLLDPLVSDESKGAFLTALHHRGETASELAGFASELLKGAVVPTIKHEKGSHLLELCGTGGDHAGLLNISTAAMFVASGAGARVVKHGNRAVSSKCGSADVLEALGVTLHLRPDRVGDIVDRAGCVFLLASDFHPAVAAVAGLRRSLASRGQMTIFNLLGPLLNPASPEVQLTGIYTPAKLKLYAEAMRILGRRVAWAVHGEGINGEGGFDEISLLGISHVVAIRDGVMERMTIQPEDFGLPKASSVEGLVGGDAKENALRIEALLTGVESGVAREMILLNAGAALFLAGIGSSLPESASLAAESIDSGGAARALELLRKASEAARL